jgi:hypothetical protein
MCVIIVGKPKVKLIEKMFYSVSLLSETDSSKLESGKGAGMDSPVNFSASGMSVPA